MGLRGRVNRNGVDWRGKSLRVFAAKGGLRIADMRMRLKRAVFIISPKVSEFDGEKSKLLMEQLVRERGEDIRGMWRSRIKEVREILRGTRDVHGMAAAIATCADEIGRELGIRMDADTVNVSAQARQVLIRILSEVLNEDREE